MDRGRLANGGCAVFLALLLLAGVHFNVAMLPYPLWSKIVQPVAIVIAVVFAYRWSSRPRAAAADGSI